MSDIACGQIGAISGLMHRSKKSIYSITSSANCWRCNGMWIPSALAVEGVEVGLAPRPNVAYWHDADFARCPPFVRL